MPNATPSINDRHSWANDLRVSSDFCQTSFNIRVIPKALVQVQTVLSRIASPAVAESRSSERSGNTTSEKTSRTDEIDIERELQFIRRISVHISLEDAVPST